MCGICGIFDKDSQLASLVGDDKWIWKMTSTLRHRGPDAMGVYLNGPIALGSTRLAIIDPTPSGNQPMVLQDGDYAITFNGEIYNYIELKKGLEKTGVRFRTNSDTEVLLRLYIEKGTQCLGDLRGMFAFAIWDRKKRQLFLARDRAGEKPLVYASIDGLFCFGSEIKSLLALPQIPQEIDPVGLHFGLHHVMVPAPYSAFKQVRKMKPAEYMIVSAEGVVARRYWKPVFSTARMIMFADEAAYEINRCLDETVRIICRSDVPIAAMLSGGLDSSAVVASMRRFTGTVDTFYVGSDMAQADPALYASLRVADHLKTRHHALTFSRENLAIVRDVIKSFDEPVATFVPLHAHTLASLISRHVKVALNGSGGDELFGGYRDHRMLMRLERKKNLWRNLEKWQIGRLLQRLPSGALQQSMNKYRRLCSTPPNRIFADMRIQKIHSFYAEMYSDQMRRLTKDCDLTGLLAERFDEYGAGSLLEGLMYQLLMVGSQHSIVDTPDISGMAYSLEYRSPFLDVKMMELAMRIPVHLKVRVRGDHHQTKWILRHALKNRLPADIVHMGKSGFGETIPYRTWMLNDWRDYIEAKLSSPRLKDTGWFNIDKLKNYYHAAQASDRGSMEMLWGVITTAEWLETYL